MQHEEQETKDAAVQDKEAAAASLPPLAKIKLLYESRDRRMCLFEDEHGHLQAAPSSRLA